MKNKILSLLICVLLLSCSSDDNNQQGPHKMRIDHYKTTGIGEGPMLTYLVQENEKIGSDDWNKFYHSIEGFDYQPGFIYDLIVTVEVVEDPLPNGSLVKYILQEIESTQMVDNEITFDIDLKIDGQSFITTTSGYAILDQIEIDCNSLCDELDTKLQNQEAVVGTFNRNETNELQLIDIE